MERSTGRSSVSIVWSDLDQTRIFHFSEERMEREVLRASPLDLQVLAEHLRLAGGSIVLLGPGSISQELLALLKESHPTIARRVVGCEVSDHPTDAEIATFASNCFRTPVA